MKLVFVGSGFFKPISLHICVTSQKKFYLNLFLVLLNTIDLSYVLASINALKSMSIGKHKAQFFVVVAIINTKISWC